MQISMTIAEAAKMTGVGRSTLYKSAARGELRFKKFGRRSLILTEDLMAWLKSQPDAVLTKIAA